ncbi:MAG: hypothetical protein ACXV3D_08875 [Halobacteriota archaeon]
MSLRGFTIFTTKLPADADGGIALASNPARVAFFTHPDNVS